MLIKKRDVFLVVSYFSENLWLDRWDGTKGSGDESRWGGRYPKVRLQYDLLWRGKGVSGYNDL